MENNGNRNETDFTRYLMREFRAWEERQGGKRSVSEWARRLGVKQPTLSRWMNGDTTPDAAGVAVLVEQLGSEVYEILGIQAPEEISVSGLPDEFRRRLEAATVEARNALTGSGIDASSMAGMALVAGVFARHGFEIMATEAK
jgi:transcriptional regulator with XRE-family HTH domain